MNGDALKSEMPMPMCLKHRVYNLWIKPAIIYGWETWRLTNQTEILLGIAEKAVGSAMLGLSPRNRNR